MAEWKRKWKLLLRVQVKGTDYMGVTTAHHYCYIITSAALPLHNVSWNKARGLLVIRIGG